MMESISLGHFTTALAAAGEWHASAITTLSSGSLAPAIFSTCIKFFEQYSEKLTH
jgi:hypothetical protein